MHALYKLYQRGSLVRGNPISVGEAAATVIPRAIKALVALVITLNLQWVAILVSTAPRVGLLATRNLFRLSMYGIAQVQACSLFNVHKHKDLPINTTCKCAGQVFHPESGYNLTGIGIIWPTNKGDLGLGSH